MVNASHDCKMELALACTLIFNLSLLLIPELVRLQCFISGALCLVWLKSILGNVVEP